MTLRLKYAWLLILSVILCAGTAEVLVAQEGDQGGTDLGDDSFEVESLIDRAAMFYWMALSERGGMTAIEHGLDALEEAENQVGDARVSAIRKQELGREIAALRSDLDNQRKIHRNTHYGVFPLSRFVAPTLFSNSRASGSYELIDDPDEVATREAAGELIEYALAAQFLMPQFDVVFVSDPPSRELEYEALYQFKKSQGFFVHTRHELASVLDDHEVDEIWPGGQPDPSTRILGNLVGRWKDQDMLRSSHLLLVRIRKIDEVQGDLFYTAEGRTFDTTAGATATETSPVFEEYGFCFDRRGMLIPILGLHGLFLLASLILYPLLVKLTSHARQMPSWQNTLVCGGLGFLWGRCLIWALTPVLASFEPVPETPVIWSFWWPAVAGAVITLGPAAILGFADRRFNWFGSAFSTFNRGGALFASITLGSASFLGQSVLIYKGMEGWALIPPLLLGVVMAGFLVGRALDKTDSMPVSAGILAGVLTLGLGAAWCHASSGFLWLMLLPLGIVLSVSLRKADKTASAVPAETTPYYDWAKAGKPSNCQELAERAYDPPFYESASFLKLDEALKPWREGKTVKLGLKGPAGVGKSAALNAIAAKAREHYPELIVLEGVCNQPQNGSNDQPYEPFAEAIAEHFAVNLLAPHGDQMGKIDEALGGIFDHVVPFADILFPPGEQSQTGSRQELFTAISAMIRRLASQHPLMLILDDVHWMDNASRDLLEFLLVEFAGSDRCPLAILLASRSELEFAEGFEDASVLTVQPLSTHELRSILVEGLDLNSDVAGEILGAAGQQRENLHWLFQIIAHLAQHGLLVRRDSGFSSKDPGVRIGEHMPDDIRESLEEEIAKHHEFRPVLECAACLGQEFSVELISSGVGLPRLELIRLLDRIEEQTGFVTDLRKKDDHFAFRSSFFLEVLRQSREINAGGPSDTGMPLRVREYHYRLAKALEQTLDDSNSALYAVANHYFAAGGRHAGKALQYTVKAAKAACFQFQHDLARKYLAMAEECAPYSRNEDVDFERALLLIRCHQAHVEGKGRVSTAQEALEFLERRPDSDFDLYRAVVQASYDAGIDTRDQQHFADCIRVAEAMRDRFPAPVQQAEAYHFLGIGLPPGEVDERRRRLRAASDLAGKACQANGKDLDAFRLKARIAGSLAEQLSYGDPAEREEARELFELSIEIKQREDIRDLEGLAFAYGGLGRLAFFGDPPDFDTARNNFEEDLRYSERIGSVTGQTKMHSLLGACILGESHSGFRFHTALAHYEAAHAAAVARVDRLFALAGLLECHGALEDPDNKRRGRHAKNRRQQHADAIEKYGNELYEQLRNAVAELPEPQRDSDPIEAIPRMCRENIVKALKTCRRQAESQWHRWLTNLLAGNPNPS